MLCVCDSIVCVWCVAGFGWSSAERNYAMEPARLHLEPVWLQNFELLKSKFRVSYIRF